ncbi:uncharacterized protein B0I36DRAFT_14155 [Microdochium trichocladiopsis]|uniref:Uncharacterized protein n=1 Tax=Microdochium trichocladiopsis TaxID=1682393 RepID=A0A9P8YI41_9PEZI|nr:uncharacterized protein B0I36DRAFT_14155 [Microdochium trichocladiopsis]KAH7040700.1 hypothetical protein B0I36DRAFT_14155 [Microdochium trichocladiopsis]
MRTMATEGGCLADRRRVPLPAGGQLSPLRSPYTITSAAFCSNDYMLPWQSIGASGHRLSRWHAENQRVGNNGKALSSKSARIAPHLSAIKAFSELYIDLVISTDRILAAPHGLRCHATGTRSFVYVKACANNEVMMTCRSSGSMTAPPA